MYAKITKDLLHDDTLITDGRTGLEWKGEPQGGILRVRILDDDREVYYEAVADDEALETLLDWAMRDAGATILQVRYGNEWRDTIS